MPDRRLARARRRARAARRRSVGRGCRHPIIAAPKLPRKKPGSHAVRVHHALRHAGRAAGVEHVDVVAAGARCAPRARAAASIVSSGTAPSTCRRRPRAVVDLDHARVASSAFAQHARDPVAEARVEDQHLHVGVVEQVAQLVVEVAVVDVDRDAAHLDRGVVRSRTRCSCRGRARPSSPAQAGVEEGLRETRRLLVVLAPRHSLVSVDQRGPVTDLVGDLLPDVREVDLHADPPARLLGQQPNVGHTKPWTGWGVYGDSSAEISSGVSSMSTDHDRVVEVVRLGHPDDRRGDHGVLRHPGRPRSAPAARRGSRRSPRPRR